MQRDTDLSPAMVRALRALSQPCEVQVRLFPTFVCVPDELVDDFGDAYDAMSEREKALHPDLVVLEMAILDKSGQLEFWTADALKSSDFWHDLRLMAFQALVDRDLPITPPEPDPRKTYISFPRH